LGKTQKV
jgi:hypothetical protein